MRKSSDSLVRQLQTAHGMEQHSLALLNAAADATQGTELHDVYQSHTLATREHVRLVERLLAGRGATAALAPDVREQATAGALRLVAALHRDAPERVLAATYGYEHFEIATYEILRRSAARTFDGELVTACDRLLAEERAAIDGLGAAFALVTEPLVKDMLGRSR